jgi:hypothetical protein
MSPLKDAMEGVGTLYGAALALTCVAAAFIAEATGWERARRVVDRIEKQFGIDETDEEGQR